MFNISDVDDVDIYVAQPIWEWQQTDKGKWVMENARDLVYLTQPDHNYWGYQIAIRGELADPRKITEYYLRWSK